MRAQPPGGFALAAYSRAPALDAAHPLLPAVRVQIILYQLRAASKQLPRCRYSLHVILSG